MPVQAQVRRKQQTFVRKRPSTLTPDALELSPQRLRLERLEARDLLTLARKLLLLARAPLLARVLAGRVLAPDGRLEVTRVALDGRRVRLLEAEVVRALKVVDDVLELVVELVGRGIGAGVRVGMSRRGCRCGHAVRHLLIGGYTPCAAVDPTTVIDVAM
jgi:hypothetical protein